MRLLTLLAITAAAAEIAASQIPSPVMESGGRGGGPGYFRATITIRPSPGAFEVIANAPFSAEWTGESVRTLADGGHITNTHHFGMYYRDSQGRVRREERLNERPGPMNPMQLIAVEITDPADGVVYELDSEHKIAHRLHISTVKAPSSPKNPARPTTTPSTGPGRPAIQTEPLGTQIIEGVPAEGTRTTFTIPPGGSNTSDHDLVQVQESWRALDLKVVILAKTIGPEPQGTQTTRASNISLRAPDASLFRIPNDYQIVDETGPFTFTFSTGTPPALPPNVPRPPQVK